MDSTSTAELRKCLENLGYEKSKNYKSRVNVQLKHYNYLVNLDKFNFGNDVGHKISLRDKGSKVA